MDYDLLEKQATALCADERNFIANSANIAALLFNELPEINWAGFYFVEGADLVLGPFCGKPACTRLKNGAGVCGVAVRERRTLVVDDVHTFPGHVACDSASQSEIAVPLMLERAVLGVLDVDSPTIARFSASDQGGLQRIAERLLELSALPRSLVEHSPPLDINDRITIQTCRDQHVVIRYLLEEMSSNVPPAKMLELLRRLKTMLLAHLRLEDEWLFPKLLGGRNAELAATARRHQSEMGGIKDSFVTLMGAWDSHDSMAARHDLFKLEWATFNNELLRRIRREDEELYSGALDAD